LAGRVQQKEETMYLVKINQVDEFIEEIRKECQPEQMLSNIEGNIIRLTMLYTQSKLSPNIHLVEVISNFVVRDSAVQLSRFCGDIWNINNENDQKTMDKANECTEQIEAVAKELGLEVRSGTIELVGEVQNANRK